MYTLVAKEYIIAAGSKRSALDLDKDDIAEILKDKYFLSQKDAEEIALAAEIIESTPQEITKQEIEVTKKARIKAKTQKEKKVVFYRDKDTKELKVELQKVPTSPYCKALKEAGHKCIYVFTWEEAFETPFEDLQPRLIRDYIGVIKKLRPLKSMVADTEESDEIKNKTEEMVSNE